MKERVVFGSRGCDWRLSSISMVGLGWESWRLWKSWLQYSESSGHTEIRMVGSLTLGFWFSVFCLSCYSCFHSRSVVFVFLFFLSWGLGRELALTPFWSREVRKLMKVVLLVLYVRCWIADDCYPVLFQSFCDFQSWSHARVLLTHPFYPFLQICSLASTVH